VEEAVEHVLVAEALQLGAVVVPPLSQLLGLRVNIPLSSEQCWGSGSRSACFGPPGSG
jgi:hypothetical protein